MTGRERVTRALTFDTPDRVPRDLWALPGVAVTQEGAIAKLRSDFPMDIEKPEISPGQSREAQYHALEVGSYVDEWGSVWYRGEPGIIGEVKEPVLADWSKLDSFLPPWETIRDRDLTPINRQCATTDAFVLSAVTARPFERLQFLRGSENLFMDMGYGLSEFRTLLEMVHAYYLEDVEAWCATDVDGVVLMDDWGSEISLLVSPSMWRELFKPMYRDYCDLIHRAGKFAFFHSDGYIEPVIGDLIEVGVDALNAQLFITDIEKIAQSFRGKVTFWGEIDRQHVLPSDCVDEVWKAVRRVRKALDSGEGGVIAQCEWGKENPEANIRAVFEAWMEEI